MMRGTCVACENPLQPGGTHCSRCGFPIALTAAALIAMGPEDSDGPSNLEPLPPATAARSAAASADPEHVALAETAGRLLQWQELLRGLDSSHRPEMNDVRSAALYDAQGRTSEAMQLIRGASTVASETAEELIGARLQEFEQRVSELSSEGLSAGRTDDYAPIRSELERGHPAGALEMLRAEDRRLRSISQNWNSLKSTLRQVDQLRSAARLLGESTESVDPKLERVRALLGSGQTGATELLEAAQSAEQVLDSLQAEIPRRIETHLEKHEALLDNFAPGHGGAEQGKRLHAESLRHLRHGRVTEAAHRLAELQRLLGELGDPTKSAAAGGVSPGTFPDLVAKAREIALRVRDLPQDSPVAQVALRSIQSATMQLKKGELPEAAATLSEIVRILDSRHQSGS